MAHVEEIPSEDQVFEHIEGIPPKLRKCAAAQHNWQPLEWTGYTKNGKALSRAADPTTASWFDVTQICGGQRGCGYQRHFQMGWHRGRLVKTTNYTYSDRNPHLVSPPGISHTGIVVRSEMVNTLLGAHILQRRMTIAPTGTTKRALADSGAA